MRICDRCGAKSIRKILQDKQEFTEFDLCIGCYDEFLLFMESKNKDKPECHVKKRKAEKGATKPAINQGG